MSQVLQVAEECQEQMGLQVLRDKLVTGVFLDLPESKENMEMLEGLDLLVSKVLEVHQEELDPEANLAKGDPEERLVLMARMEKLGLREFKDCLDQWDFLETREFLERLDKKETLELLEILVLEEILDLMVVMVLLDLLVLLDQQVIEDLLDHQEQEDSKECLELLVKQVSPVRMEKLAYLVGLE